MNQLQCLENSPFSAINPVPFEMQLGNAQAGQPHRRGCLPLWQDAQCLLVDLQSAMKLPLLLQLVAQVPQAACTDMRTVGIADRLLQSVVSSGAIFEAKSNPQAHCDHAAHEDAAYRQIIKRTTRKLDCLRKVQTLGCDQCTYDNHFTLDCRMIKLLFTQHMIV